MCDGRDAAAAKATIEQKKTLYANDRGQAASTDDFAIERSQQNEARQKNGNEKLPAPMLSNKRILHSAGRAEKNGLPSGLVAALRPLGPNEYE